MRYVIIVILAVIYTAVGCPDYMASEQGLVIRALTYHIYHANIFHLLANCLSVYLLFDRVKVADVIKAYAIATVTYMLSVRPVVGFSNIIFALSGLRTSGRFINFRDPAFIAFVSVNGVMLLFPQFAALTHILSFACGFLLAQASRRLKALEHDYKRASR